MSSYSGKRLCGMMDDGLDDLLSQAVGQCEKEEVDLDDGLDGILSQSLDIFEQKSLDDDAIDITDMFESVGPSLVMARRFRTAKGNPFETSCASVLRYFFFVDDKLIRGVTGHRSEALQSYKRETDEQLVRVSKIVQGQSSENTRHQENFAAVQIPTLSGALLNVSGGNCNITINKN